MPYTRDRQQYKIKLSMPTLTEEGASKFHNRKVRHWLEENIEGLWSMEAIAQRNTLDDEMAEQGGFEYSFEDLSEATLFRLRF